MVRPAGLCLVGGLLAASGLCQAGTPPVFGTLDPRTNLFTPRPIPHAAQAAPVGILRSGVLQVNVTVSVPSFIPQSEVLLASVTASCTDPSFSSSSVASGNPARSGNTAKLTLTMPYAFTVASTSDVVTVYFEMFIGTQTIQLTQTIKLPADGATTPVTIVQVT